MISHEHRAIFIHQRKCAGTSIIHALGVRSLTDPDWHYANDGVLSPEFYSRPRDYLVLSIVRNPWDRLVSSWLYCESTRDRPLREVLNDLPREGRDYRHVGRPQRDILFDRDNHLVADLLLRFEDLPRDWERACAALGMPPVPLPHLNAVPDRRPYREYFADPSLRDLFLMKFGRDVDAFGYEF